MLNVGDRELSAPSYLSARRTLSVRGGEPETLEITLEPEPGLGEAWRVLRDRACAKPGGCFATGHALTQVIREYASYRCVR